MQLQPENWSLNLAYFNTELERCQKTQENKAPAVIPRTDLDALIVGFQALLAGVHPSASAPQLLLLVGGGVLLHRPQLRAQLRRSCVCLPQPPLGLRLPRPGRRTLLAPLPVNTDTVSRKTNCHKALFSRTAPSGRNTSACGSPAGAPCWQTERLHSTKELPTVSYWTVRQPPAYA